jgi:hypothetical protein
MGANVHARTNIDCDGGVRTRYALTDSRNNTADSRHNAKAVDRFMFWTKRIGSGSEDGEPRAIKGEQKSVYNCR